MNPDPDEHVHPGEEEMEWGEGISVKKREKKPQSRYWAISEQARKMFPGERQCKMFCGGKHCKYCTPNNWTGKEMVIDGLYSHWVTDNILAMARMSNANIDKFKFLEQFDSVGIKTVINLQEPGEHAHCGAGNVSGGFSYDPQRLMAAKLFFYNFVMKDYGVAPMSTLLDTVKVMQFAVSVGKVAVHCHAGLGRTGLIIACYLIYNNRVNARKAIQYVRSRRPGSIQTKQQVMTCHEFEQYLQVYFIVFTTKIPNAHPISFSLFLVRQRQLLHGYEARKLKHIPKVVYVCCERLLELCGKGSALTSLRNSPIDPLPEELLSLPEGCSPRPADNTLSEFEHKKRLQTLSLGLPGSGGDEHSFGKSRANSLKVKERGIKESLSSSKINDMRSIDQNTLGVSSPTLSRSLKSLDISAEPRSKLQARRNHLDYSELSLRKKNTAIVLNQVKHSNGATNGKKRLSQEDSDDERDEDGDDHIIHGHTEEEYEKAKLQAAREAKKAEEEEVKMYVQKSSLSRTDSLPVIMTVQEISEAAVVSENSPKVTDQIERYKDKLNKSHQGWQLLAAEEDPAVICGLMSSWLDHLNEPVLRYQDIMSIIGNESNLERAFLGLESSTKYFLEYLLVVLCKFDPVGTTSLFTMLELMLSNLCQHHLGLGYVKQPSYMQDSARPEVKPDYADALFHLFLDHIALVKRRLENEAQFSEFN
ncbi:tyrosine phosphatase domain-containing protein 1 [Elysia marginata]|uniref:Tyrosine phosphatase domain-containing protein 1 n=1 Tax=Elysia marginata TaxID=1093978 RepID=A0AAV4H8K5_9GAST|nr:tyrosine phosphatase domain-containing protein 1 [Elysia marginata]